MSRSYLTDSFVRNLDPGGGRREIRDSVVPGLGLRAGSHRKVWFFVYPSPEERNGAGKPRRRRVTLGRYPRVTLAQARAEAARLRDEVRGGLDPLRARKAPMVKGVRFEILAADYLERYAKVKKFTWKRDEWILRKILVPAFGARAAESITAREIRDLLEGLVKRGPNTVNATHTVISRALSWGVQRFDLPGNPARMVEALCPKAERDRVLTPAEVGRIWRACEAAPQVGGALIRLRLATAQRGAQLGRLNVNQLEHDGADVWWNVPGQITKSRRPNRVYLSPLALEVLAERRTTLRGQMLADPQGRPLLGHVPTHVLKPIVQAAGVPDWFPADMRRTAATWMAQRGVSRFLIKRVLGHADREITAVYDRYSYDKEVKAAVLTLEQAIREAIAPASFAPEDPTPDPLEES